MQSLRVIIIKPLLLLILLSFSPLIVAADGELQHREIALTDLLDKIRGGWAGQMIGVGFGFPTEFAYREKIIPENELPVWRAEMIEAALSQDDLYVDITFAQVLDEHGLQASSEDFAALFKDAEYPLWHANLAARRALRRGVSASLSGSPQYNVHAHDIDFQIESDFIGLMSPGLPKASNELALRAGRVVNHGDGIYGGMFISAMYASAFFSNSPAEIVKAGLAALPAESDYARLIQDVVNWWQEEPENWQLNWQRIHDKWNQGEMCPEGVLQPFNIDAKINGAYVALGLLYGKGDFEQSMLISTRAGQDSDCNPSNALGILGVVLGFDGIPQKFTSALQAIADKKFSYTSYSYNDIVDSSYRRALQLVKQEGGHVDNKNLYVPLQNAEAADLQKSITPAAVKEEILFTDPRWQWQGPWLASPMKIWRYTHESMISDSEDAQATISFEGSGVVVKGILLPNGGTLDIELDNKLVQTVDVYSDEDNAKPQEGLWHRFDLAKGKHELKLKVRGETFPGSSGKSVSISSLLVYDR